MSIFRWESIRVIGPCKLPYVGPVAGKILEVELSCRQTIRVWQGDDGRSYFCHGLTFGGKEAPGGPISPFTGEPVETILHEYYEQIPEPQATIGDILVWYGIWPNSTPHSAVLIGPKTMPGEARLDDRTLVRTKNGMMPEAELSLQELNGLYGQNYNVYRRRGE